MGVNLGKYWTSCGYTMLHQKPQNLAHLLSIGKTWHTFWVLSKPGKTETWHAFRAIGKSWQKKNPPLPTIGKTCQNQNQAFRVLAKPGMPSQYGQNQNHPFPFLGKFGRTKTCVLGASKT